MILGERVEYKNKMPPEYKVANPQAWLANGCAWMAAATEKADSPKIQNGRPSNSLGDETQVKTP